MKKNLLLSLLLLSSFYTQAKPLIYQLPKTLHQQLKIAAVQQQKTECEQQKLPLSYTLYEFNDKLLLFIGLPDYFCHAHSVVPVVIDSKGHWQTGTVIDSKPSSVLTMQHQALWLISHLEIEAVAPLLHHSIDGIHWQEISLPQHTVNCCFVWLKQVCINNANIQLKLTGIDNTPVEYWSSTLADSLKPKPNWQKITAQDHQSCQNSDLTSGDWQQKTTDNTIYFESKNRHIRVIMPRWL